MKECPVCREEGKIVELLLAWKVYDLDERGDLSELLEVQTRDEPSEWQCRECGVMLEKVETREGVYFEEANP